MDWKIRRSQSLRWFIYRFFVFSLFSYPLGYSQSKIFFSSVWQNCPIVKTNTFKKLRTVYLSPRYKPRYDEGLKRLKKIYSLQGGFAISKFFSIYFTVTWARNTVRYTKDFVIYRDVRNRGSTASGACSAGSSIRFTLFVHIKHRKNKNFTVSVMSLIANLRGYLVKSLVLFII